MDKKTKAIKEVCEKSVEDLINRAKLFLDKRERATSDIDNITLAELNLMNLYDETMFDVNQRLYKGLDEKQINTKIKKACKNPDKDDESYFINGIETRKYYWDDKRKQFASPSSIAHDMVINDLINEIECMEKFVKKGKISKEEFDAKVWGSKTIDKKIAEPKSLNR